jgi:hypothetical protein
MVGNLINHTGLAQELQAVTATFFDTQGQPMANTGPAQADWPGFVVLPNGAMPFELTVTGVSAVADYALTVEAQPSSQPPRQDFEFAEVEQKSKGSYYCVNGKFKNPGGGLRQYLALTAVLYDDAGNVVNFDYYSVYYPDGVEADPDLKFELCADPLNKPVARYELQAWGL